MKNKCLFVVGIESDATTLVAEICAYHLRVDKCKADASSGDIVVHRDLPYGEQAVFPNIDEWIWKYREYHIKFVIVNRDRGCSELSRIVRSGTPEERISCDIDIARMIMRKIMNSGSEYYVVSYEALDFLGREYMREFFEFIGSESDYLPDIDDENICKIRRSKVILVLIKRAMNFGGSVVRFGGVVWRKIMLDRSN